MLSELVILSWLGVMENAADWEAQCDPGEENIECRDEAIKGRTGN